MSLVAAEHAADDVMIVVDVGIESVGYRVSMPLGQPAARVLERFLDDGRRATGAAVE